VIVRITGTGKELIARAIHQNSSRAAKNFVVVDCATLPSAMIGSVLFGHEKGTFTGTEHRHKGLVAQDEGGAEFLDTLETYNWLGSDDPENLS